MTSSDNTLPTANVCECDCRHRMRYLRQGKDRGYTGKWVVTMQAIDDVYESGFEDGTFDDFTAALIATISESHAEKLYNNMKACSCCARHTSKRPVWVETQVCSTCA